MMLAADVGGTKILFSLFDATGQERACQRYASQEYSSLEHALESFLGGNRDLRGACFAVPGPVVSGRAAITNLPWQVDRASIAKQFGIEVCFLLNDLEASGHALSILPPSAYLPLYTPPHVQEGNRAILSPGTGLGEAALYWDGKCHHPFAAEGGHCEFGPRDALEEELAHFLIGLCGHASYESILSGPGIVRLYHFLQSSHPCPFAEQIASAQDPAPLITAHALAADSPCCVRVLELFSSILAAETGNCGLKFGALGGLFLGGGIPAKILPFLQKPSFVQSFLRKGKLSGYLQKMPITLVLEEKVALLGAKAFLYHHCANSGYEGGA